jgi:hypothetical protein
MWDCNLRIRLRKVSPLLKLVVVSVTLAAPEYNHTDACPSIYFILIINSWRANCLLNRNLLKNMTVAQLVKSSHHPRLKGTPLVRITTLKTAHSEPAESNHALTAYLRSILVLPLQRLGSHSGLFHWHFQIKMLYVSPISRLRVVCSSHLSFINSIIPIIKLLKPRVVFVLENLWKTEAVTFRNILAFRDKGLSAHCKNPSQKTTPCRLSSTAYTTHLRLTGIPEGSSARNKGRNLPLWQGPHSSVIRGKIGFSRNSNFWVLLH